MKDVEAMAVKQKEAPSFEDGIKQLEDVVSQLEDGDLALEKSLELFEKGMKLSAGCRQQLQDAEAKVEMLIRKDGAIEPQPFEVDDGEN